MIETCGCSDSLLQFFDQRLYSPRIPLGFIGMLPHDGPMHKEALQQRPNDSGCCQTVHLGANRPHLQKGMLRALLPVSLLQKAKEMT